MGQQLDPDVALEPAAVLSCYVGALGIEDDRRRLTAATAVLGFGRLGLRPGELLHLHAGWVDWERGELQVPAVDACACELCWESARVAQRAGDGRSLAAIVNESRWEGTARAIPFGWSGRLAGVLATATDAWDYLDCSAEELHALVAASAERGTGVEADTVDVPALRSAAAAFFADAGFDAPRVADVLGTDVETAAAFTGQKPGRARTHLYQAFDAEPPAAADQGGRYPLLSDPEPFEAEPFDPREFDAAWRAQRAGDAGARPAGSPRPAVVPEDVDAAAVDRDRLVASGSGSADEEASGTDASGADDAEAGGTADGTSADGSRADGTTAAEDGDDEDAADVVDLETLVTQPVAFELTTRFACSALHNGRPSGGRLLIGQSEFLLAVHGGGEIEATELVAFSAVRDVAFEWVPETLADVFEATVGVAFERDGERETAVIELPEGQRTAFAGALFAGLLGDIRAVVTHPAQVGGRVTDAEPTRDRVAVTEIGVAVGGDRIALADVIDVDREKQTLEGGDVHWGLAIVHLRGDGKPVRTVVAPMDERERTLLERYVVSDHRLRERRAEDTTLPDDQRQVLDALRTNPGTRDIGALLGLDREELEALVDGLASAGFVHATEEGVRLTGMGRMRGDALQDVDA